MLLPNPLLEETFMSTEMVPAAMPDSRLPVTYEAAQKALAECQRVDECKDWADKAAALSAYARMAKNDNLRLMALRIQERATRRMGELLKQIPAANGARTDLQPHDGTVTRSQVAEQAGLSERQKVTALRVANIPAKDFEAAVESDSPPSLSALAQRGTLPRPATFPDLLPADPAAKAAAHDRLRDFAAFCGLQEPERIAKATSDTEAFRGYVKTIDTWLDRFVTNLSP